MADVCGQGGHVRVDVDALLMPPKNRPNDKRVSEVVNTGLHSANAGKTKESRKCVVHVIVDKSRADQRNEEVW